MGADLRRALLELEHPDGLRFEATEPESDLLGELRLYDVEYRGVFLWFAPIVAYDIYRMRLRLDESRRTVTLQDERESYLQSWTRRRHDFFKGVYRFAKEKESCWGRRADGSLGRLYGYSFDSEALKQPVRELVRSHDFELEERSFS